MLKPSRRVVVLVLTVILLLGAVLAPAASAAPSSGAGCPPVYHRVVRGDMLSTIAARYGVSVWQLQQWNHIANIDRIYVGQVLVIYPAWCPQPRPQPRPQPKPLPLPGPCSGPAGCLPPPPPVCIAPGPCPVQPPVIPAVCSDPRSVISSPGQNAHVSGIATITGSAIHENFKFYKLEYGAGSNPNTWHWFFGSEWPVWQGTLGALNTSVLPGGTYTIRLTVVDRTSNYPAPCQVTVQIP